MDWRRTEDRAAELHRLHGPGPPTGFHCLAEPVDPGEPHRPRGLALVRDTVSRFLARADMAERADAQAGGYGGLAPRLSRPRRRIRVASSRQES